MNAPVRLDIDEGVARLRFCRPEAMNAINVETSEALLACCQSLQERSDVRVVVMSGEGRAFMAGGDLEAFHQASQPEVVASAIIRPLNEALSILAQLPMPVIGCVQGVAAGAGFSLAIGCDLTVCAEGTRFCLAYLGIAASIDAGGSWHLVRRIGLQRAMDLALSNRTMGADEALALGLVARVVPADCLEAETSALARQLAHGPSVAIAQVKRLLRSSESRGLDAQLAAEHDAFHACSQTADFFEGIDAFFNKRPPAFRGY